MKKSLIALAVAGVFAAPVAMADTANVNVYGVADVSFDMTNNGTGAGVGGVQGTSTHQVSSNQSRIGLKGSEDMGGGTSAIWQIETAVAIDNSSAAGGNGLATRNTFAGLSGESWGTVLLGRHDTPYKLATRGLDVFADSLADNRSLMGGAGLHDARLTDVVAYISPAMSGFTAAVAYVAGAETASTSNDVKGSAWSLAGMYNAGPINASLSYQAVDMGSAGTSNNQPLFIAVPSAPGTTYKATAWKVGGGYTMDAFTVNAAYEKLSDNFGAAGGCVGAVGTVDCGGHADWYLAGKFNVSASDAVKLAYTKANNINGGGVAANQTNTGAKQISVGYDHSMSKRTTVYALYTKVSNDTNANYGVGTTGNSGAFAGAGPSGSSPNAWSLGMKHTF